MVVILYDHLKKKPRTIIASTFYVSLFLSVTILAKENAWGNVGVFQIQRPVQPIRAWQDGE